jgi:hypothetical protein
MKVWLALAVAAPVAGFLLGTLREPDIEPLPGQAPMAAPALPSLVHSGMGLSIARQRLAGVGAGTFRPPPIEEPGLGPVFLAGGAPPPPAEMPFMDAAPPAPPPIDIASQLSRDLTAVVRGGEGSTLLLVDSSDPFGRRSLRRGETYLDGWRVREINGTEIVLGKGRSERRIPIMQGAPRPTPIALAPPPAQAEIAAVPPVIDDATMSAEYQIEDASMPAVAAQPQGEEVATPRRRISRPGRE